MKNCLFVLGMHRSGTSAFTGILNLLGVNLGTKMLETQRDNPKGFFENKYVVLANDCILESFNSSWDDPLPLPENWPQKFEESQLVDDVRHFLRTDIPDAELSALKDPRLCRLLPFWLPLLTTENITPRAVLVIRSPLEIADSLARRNGFSLDKSLVLWMQYMLEAEKNTRHMPRCFVKFEAVLSTPRETIEHVFDTIGLEKPDFASVDPEKVEQFVDQDMRHHEVSDSDLDARCHKTIADYYRLLCEVSEREVTAQDHEAFDALGEQFQINQTLFYNSDIALALEKAKQESAPDWYQAKLNRIKAQLDADKTFREYRYIANTEHLYHARIELQNQSDALRGEIDKLQAEIANLQQQIAQLQNQLNTPHLTISALRNELAVQQDDINLLNDTSSKLRADLASRVDNITGLQNDIAELQGTISSLQHEQTTLQNVIAAQKIVLTAQKSEEAARLKEVAELRENLESRQNSETQLLARNDELERIVFQLYATRPMRVYQKYQRSVEAVFPEGTLLRKLLKWTKGVLTGEKAERTALQDNAQISETQGANAGEEIEPAIVMDTAEQHTAEAPANESEDANNNTAPANSQAAEDQNAVIAGHSEEMQVSGDAAGERAADETSPANADVAIDTKRESKPELFLVPTVTAPPPVDSANDVMPATASPDQAPVHDQAKQAVISEAARLSAETKADNIYGVAVDEPAAADIPERAADPSAAQAPAATEEQPSTPDESQGTTVSGEALDPRDIVFPTTENPNVSIIIPVFNNWAFTHKCLHSLFLYNRGSYEIIVVDNNSTDETPQHLSAITGIQVITNESNEVFVNACNQAAQVARGNYLLFLNNDTEVSEGWLEAMLAPFSDASTGVVGAKLVYPDGSLQEAGGIIWNDGNGCNYGHGDNPDLPKYSYRKAVDYCSGACLMIASSLWHEIGGFDQRFAPAYYEDTDLCFTVRALNYKVIYQPAARIVHYGGASAGKETSSGYKRYQDINREKFIAKWQEVLDRDHVPSSAGLFGARERTGDKHILIIDHQVPTFDRDSGSLRMLNMLQILLDMNYKVSFWPDQLNYDAKYTRVLQDLGIETYYGDLQFENFIKEHGNALDFVMMSRPATTKKYMHLVKKYSAAKTIFDTVDLHYVREQRRLELEVQRWKNLEFFLAEEADVTLVVSHTEKQMLEDQNFADKISVVSNIHSLEPCEKGFEERSGLMFIGSFAHPPNEEGIIWFIDYILPLIKKKIPDIHLTIVGSEPTQRLLEMANESVTVTGFVEDVSGYFNDSRVFVSPLLHGAGVKGKIGQSFSYGLPVVTTSIGAEGMQLTDGLNALISDSETAFADSVIALYQDKFLWQRLSTNCRQVIREQFSTETIRTALEGIMEAESPKQALKKSVSRPVIVHCHLFKNAGSTLDWSLQRQFGAGFIDHRDDDNMRRGAAYLKPYLEAHKQVSAISSHHIRFPLPNSEELQLLPLISLRHPIDRARSVYDFERRQESNTPGAIHAKKLSFADYVRWRMQPDVAPTIRNFHCSFCTSNFDSPIGESAYLESVSMLIKTPLLVIVERYDESMVLLEQELEPYFPGIDLSYLRQNETFGREVQLVQRIESVFEQLGPELTIEFREKNHWDMKLYENSLAIHGERMGALRNQDRLMADFQARCRLLSAATLPSNARETPESQVG
ncbi:Putative mycofactocin biosynthesis glycosyltransferase MftF [Halioglobus japonicus]|nr:Putative mycofactocin biosynthesis glycosyltransferase MftF [Halioglobus japonicus]